MIVYKLTNAENKTRGGCCWTPGEWKTASGEGGLCGPGWLHCYESPEIAVFMNPKHADINNPALWLAEGKGKCKRDGQLKRGYAQMRIVERMELPVITTEQRVEIGIRCAMTVCKDAAWRKWADNWLSGKNRTAARAAEAEARAWAGEDSKLNLKYIISTVLSGGKK